MQDLDYLEHYGTPRHSGRYPWGSGENPYQRSKGFLGYVQKLRDEGMSDTDIARSMKISTTKLRNRITIANQEQWKYESRLAQKLKAKGMSNVKIGERMGHPESQIRNYLKPELQERNRILTATKDILVSELKEKKFLDVGSDVERHMGISKQKLAAAVDSLTNEGYQVYSVKVKQAGTGKYTTFKILAESGLSKYEVYKNRENWSMPGGYSEDGGRSFKKPEPPVPIDRSRIFVRYKDDPEGGELKDGLIELRRGCEDLTLGRANYAQVRIAVEGDRYMKGMAVYSDDIPKGYDIVYNTKKPEGSPDDKVFKEQKRITRKDGEPGDVDVENPFGATIRTPDKLSLATTTYLGSDGKEHQSPINIVNEQGDWSDWNRKLSSQMLSKQRPALIRQQLDATYSIQKEELGEIMSLTNPAVKKLMLNEFAGKCDTASSELKAIGMPRQTSRVLLPFTDIKDGEIYAPGYRQGETVILIRYPHGGIFEIPQLTVNNSYFKAKKVIGDGLDAVGINFKTASRLSGADFDGDTALVIPNNDGAIKVHEALRQMKDFDPMAYKLPDNAPYISDRQKNNLMGQVSNLITDMTIGGADWDEIARAVKHSMVVIDAKKHHLDVKASADEFDIPGLKAKWQGGERAGAKTIISRAGSEATVKERKEGQWIFDPVTGKKRLQYVNPETGEKLYSETGRKMLVPDTHTVAVRDENGNTVKDIYGNTVKETKVKTDENGKQKYIWKDATSEITKMEKAYSEGKDAWSLVGDKNNAVERYYAEYADKMRAMANEARKAALSVSEPKYNPSAAQAYAGEVSDILAQLNEAHKNAPLERKAQAFANARIAQAFQDNPGLKDDKDAIKKVRNREMAKARLIFGAKKPKIVMKTDRHWEAIQNGAFRKSKLFDILNNMDPADYKQRSMPKKDIFGMSSAKISRARQMIRAGHDVADVADVLGISVSTLEKAMKEQ